MIYCCLQPVGERSKQHNMHKYFRGEEDRMNSKREQIRVTVD